MRSLIFSALFLAVASVGFHALISASLAAARDARAATFSERFAQRSRPLLRAARTIARMGRSDLEFLVLTKSVEKTRPQH
jgi:hypothetical protein